MTKSELSESLLEKTSLTKEQAIEAIEVVFDIIRLGVIKDHVVIIRGFGKFYFVKEKQTNRTIPGTHLKHTIPERYSIRFKASKKILTSINSK